MAVAEASAPVLDMAAVVSAPVLDMAAADSALARDTVLVLAPVLVLVTVASAPATADRSGLVTAAATHGHTGIVQAGIVPSTFGTGTLSRT